jgi:hypothetical protein
MTAARSVRPLEHLERLLLHQVMTAEHSAEPMKYLERLAVHQI